MAHVSRVLFSIAGGLSLCAAACVDAASPRVVDEDDPGDLPTNAPVAEPPVPSSAPTIDAAFVPVHVAPTSLRIGASDLAITSPTTIDTSALTINGASDPDFIVQTDDNVALLFTGVLSVEQAVTIQGSRPLIIVASGDVAIDAPIDVSAHGRTAGPGATTTGAGGAGAQMPSGFSKESSGGGGGSYGTIGGAGGQRAPQIPGGAAGAAYGGSIQDPLVGGSPGGSGGGGPAGGAGGGAFQISSASAIHVASTIGAGGGGGRGGAFGINAGGGGGAGGEIVLEAPAISFASSPSPALVALGGGGGAGGSQNTAGSPGLDGSDAALTGGLGGAAGVPIGAPGGDGARVASGAFVAAQTGGGSSLGNGGGGGGGGRIWLRYRATSPAPLASVGAPAAGLDPTLP